MNRKQCLTSASRITLFPSGQMMWSTWERTRSHVSSGVRRLAYKSRDNSVTISSSSCLTWTHYYLVHHVDLCVGVSHVADHRTVFHPVQLVSGHHIFIPCRKTRQLMFSSSAEWNKQSTLGNGVLKRSPMLVTGAGDENINMANDLIQLHHSESIHAVKQREKIHQSHLVWTFYKH